jgi:hypothetical protein
MFYLILGETPVQNKISLLTISGYDYVGEIRSAIYKNNERKVTFNGIGENDLKLWQVDDIDKNKIRMLDEKLHGININKDLNGIELFPRDEIPNKLKDKSIYIHIIVELTQPANTGKCLPTVYLSNKNIFAIIFIYNILITFVSACFIGCTRATANLGYTPRRECMYNCINWYFLMAVFYF